MKILIMGILLVTSVVICQAHAEDAAGSNAGGTEKVCSVGSGVQSEAALAEALKSCRRGDILDIGYLQTPIAMQLCDFSKAMLYHTARGSVIACVYTGARRPANK